MKNLTLLLIACSFIFAFAGDQKVHIKTDSEKTAAIDEELYNKIKEKLLNDREFQKRLFQNIGIEFQDGIINIGEKSKNNVTKTNIASTEKSAASQTNSRTNVTVGDRKTYETIKSRINGLGNKGLPQQTKQDMMSFLLSYQKSHPEDALEASNLINNLGNR